MATKRPKWSEAQIKAHIQTIQKIVDKGKRENKGEHFIGITPEQIREKLKRVHSPFFTFLGWNSTTPGGTVNLNVGIFNPDPTTAGSLFAHVWIGSGNVDPTVGTFLLNVDTRFPRLTEPPFFGLTLASGASATLSYSLKVPAAAEKTNYLGNATLMQFNWFNVGLDLERAVFVFEVS
jgi:hypothetical protein